MRFGQTCGVEGLVVCFDGVGRKVSFDKMYLGKNAACFN